METTDREARMADTVSGTALLDLAVRDLRIPDAELSPAEYRRRQLLRFTGELAAPEPARRG